MKLPIVAICAISLSSLSPAHTREVTLKGAGAFINCGTWIDKRKKNTISWGNELSWALGFISAGAYYGRAGDPFEKIDPIDVAYWLDKYCKNNPTSGFLDAVTIFIEVHKMPTR
jgi:hypothetical protein